MIWKYIIVAALGRVTIILFGDAMPGWSKWLMLVVVILIGVKFVYGDIKETKKEIDQQRSKNGNT